MEQTDLKLREELPPLKKAKRKNWIKKLKQESWNAELLITTVSIFGSIKLFDLVDWLTNYFINNLDPSQYQVAYFIVIISMMAVSVMVSMFVIHFCLRAYWIGLLGLNSVFPDYDLDSSVYPKIYTEKWLASLPKLKDTIKRVDELCSLIFSITFSFLSIYAFLAFFASMYLLMYNLLIDSIPAWLILVPLYFIGLLLVLTILFTLLGSTKKLKNSVSFQSITVGLSKFISRLLYGPFYKPLSQVLMIFGTNIKKNKNSFYFILILLFCSFGLFFVKSFDGNIFYLMDKRIVFDTTKSRSSFYSSEQVEDDFLLNPEIESDVVVDDVVRLFIPIYNYEKKLRKEVCEPILEPKSASREKKLEALLACYSEYNQVSINDGEVLELDFMGRYHAKTEQFGVITYIPLTELKSGMHKIKVRKYYGEGQDAVEWLIPFYYAPNEQK